MTETFYRLASGVRLREKDGEAMLLVPEGIVTLNDTAAAALGLADGSRDLDAIVATLAERFDASPNTLAQDVRDLFDAMLSRGFVTE